MLEIKMEVEAYTGTPINLDKEFSKARADIKKQGGKAPERGFEFVITRPPLHCDPGYNMPTLRALGQFR